MSSPSDTSYDPSQVPALDPPLGVIPNFDDPYTQGPKLLALSAVAMGIMYLFVILRSYSKFCVQKKYTLDDLTCILATLGTTGLFVGSVFLEKAGLGTHQWNLRAIKLIDNSFLVPLYILTTVQPLVSLFIKLSFLIYFLQIFYPKPILRWSILIGAFVTTAFYTAVTIALFVLATPRPGVTFAEQFISFLSQKSSPVLDATFALGYFNVLSDLYILILPISGVMSLNLRPKRKFGVSLIFMTGLLALASSSAALYYRYSVNHSGDSTWNLMPASYLTILELTIGIDCACMPACFVATRRCLPLFATFRSQLASLLRTWGARLSPSGSSGISRYFSRSRAKSSTENRKAADRSPSEEVFVLESLPRIPRGVHQMRTARDIIWGNKRRTDITADDEDTTIDWRP